MPLKKEQPSLGPQRVPEPTVGRHLEFDLDAEIDKLHGEPAWQTGRNSKTMVKYPDFRLVLTAMKASTRTREHQAAGRISVQAVRGHIRMHTPEQVFDLPTGHILCLDRAVPHDVEAMEDSAFLLTIAWPEM